jgi:hypothetical protein
MPRPRSITFRPRLGAFQPAMTSTPVRVSTPRALPEPMAIEMTSVPAVTLTSAPGVNPLIAEPTPSEDVPRLRRSDRLPLQND